MDDEQFVSEFLDLKACSRERTMRGWSGKATQTLRSFSDKLRQVLGRSLPCAVIECAVSE